MDEKSLPVLPSAANAQLNGFSIGHAWRRRTATNRCHAWPRFACLGASRNDGSRIRITRALSPPAPAPLQTAVLDSLKRMRSPRVPVCCWKLAGRSPGLRQSCIEILLSRDEWTKELLDSLEKAVVAPSEISSADRHGCARIAKRKSNSSLRHFSSWSKAIEPEVLAKFHGATTLPEIAAKGSDIFAKNCATCHVLRGQGYNVGPTLWRWRTNHLPTGCWGFSIRMLSSNRAIVAYNIETRDDRSLSGIVSAETATTLTLIQGGGVQENILRGDIASMRASGLSLMPEGLEQASRRRTWLT